MVYIAKNPGRVSCLSCDSRTDKTLRFVVRLQGADGIRKLINVMAAVLE